jgi:hypothetical protein
VGLISVEDKNFFYVILNKLTKFAPRFSADAFLNGNSKVFIVDEF